MTSWKSLASPTTRLSQHTIRGASAWHAIFFLLNPTGCVHLLQTFMYPNQESQRPACAKLDHGVGHCCGVDHGWKRRRTSFKAWRAAAWTFGCGSDSV